LALAKKGGFLQSKKAAAIFLAFACSKTFGLSKIEDF
jgi:hypothetical protein